MKKDRTSTNAPLVTLVSATQDCSELKLSAG